MLRMLGTGKTKLREGRWWLVGGEWSGGWRWRWRAGEDDMRVIHKTEGCRCSFGVGFTNMYEFNAHSEVGQGRAAETWGVCADGVPYIIRAIYPRGSSGGVGT